MNELEQNYLAHHGILGQRWHKRNGPPYPLDAGDHSKSEKEAGYKKSLGGGRNEEMYDRKTRKRAAKEATKDLNRNDQEMAENRYKFNQAKKKYDKYSAKMLKAKEGSKKKEKYASKSLDAYLDSEEAREAIDKGQDRAREILGYLEENGYNVKTRDTMRSVARGENLVKSMLLTGLATGAATAIAGPAGMSAAAVAFTTDRVKGTKFKVKDDKNLYKEDKHSGNLYKDLSKDMKNGKVRENADKYKDDPTIKKIINDPELQKAREKLKNTKYDGSADDYNPYDNPKAIEKAKKNFEKGEGHKYDADKFNRFDDKMFDYYLDEAIGEFPKPKKTNWDKAYDEYTNAMNNAINKELGKKGNKTVKDQRGMDYHYNAAVDDIVRELERRNK